MEIGSKSVLLTGATSGIGLAIGKQLANEGYQIFGLGRNIEKISDLPANFKLFACDITDDKAVSDLLNKIKQMLSGKQPDIVIHCAGVGYYGPHETLTNEQIKELVRTNLEAPMILTSLLLPSMKQRGSGHFVFLSSVTAEKVNTYGCAYGATKAALSSFATSLFDEVRKTGIKVTIIQPDMTMTDLYRNADFTADETACIFPEDIAQTVSFALTLPEHCNLTELTIQPQKHRIIRK